MSSVTADVASSRGAPGDGLRQEYGSLRGWTRHLAWSASLRIGFLQYYRRLDWSRVRRFVFVCHGNICRSPYAARRARASGLHATSCGLDIGDNDAIHPVAADIAWRRGLDLRRHRPRGLAAIHAAPEDLFVATEPGQLRYLRLFAELAGAQTTLLGLWSTPPRPHLTDPYGGSVDYFNRCFMIIDSAVVRLGEMQREAVD
jgi:protein-tyrosine phosphatase